MDESTRILAAAFADDPVMRWVFPTDTEARLQVLWPVTLPTGVVDLGDGAVAIWHPPGGPSEEGDGSSLASLDATELGRLGALGEAMTAAHPSEPHWYLLAIGTDPAVQGRGRGGTLLRAGLERAAGSPAYLESTNPRNVTLYLRHGFEVVGEIAGHGGPPLTAMWRPADV
jgi:GNAT superfamily N-acetyltransferase